MNKKMYIITITAMVLISSITIISYNNTLNDNKAVLHIDTFNDIITETTNDNNTEDTTDTEPEETPSQDIPDDVSDDTTDIEETIEEAVDTDTPSNPSNGNPSNPTDDTPDDTPDETPDDTPDRLLLILSPQYNEDPEILDAITNYQNAVFDDIGWNSLIHSLTDDENHYDTLFDIIKTYYEEGDENLKAVMLIGEDIHLELGAEFHVGGGGHHIEESPRLFYIATLQKESFFVEEGFKILPTMIFPNACDSYEVKKDQLIFTFNKFSNRSYEYGDRVCGYNWPIGQLEHTPDRNQFFESVIDPLGDVSWTTNSVSMSGLLDGKYKMVLLSGHGEPSIIWPSNYNNQPRIVRTYGYINTHDIVTPL